ncbi:hypothetical protein [Plesiocystis pacifica]|uniref:hypothetical protein n=1 Tax=Plesiocystis pacifica TaxID=191768 RepID=UPI0012FCF1D2|nr:hypothetical protein [Plesiocystis pacifica]
MNKRDLAIPRLGDQTFISNGLDAEVAYLHRGGSFWGYALGFKSAADILVQQAVDGGAVIDSVVYPICFLYRHYIELTLKALAKQAAQLSSTPGREPDHKIIPLWKTIRKAVDTGGDTADLDAVEETLREWDRYDRGSLTFRYPTKKGSEETTIPEDLTNINLAHIADQVAKLDNFFAGLDGYFDDLLSP